MGFTKDNIRNIKVAGASSGAGLFGFTIAGPIGGLAGLIFGAILGDSSIPKENRPWREIASIIAEGESSKIEFKSSLISKNTISDKVFATISAMANTSGGYLLIGIGDDGLPCGIQSDFKRKYKDKDQWLKALCDKISSDIGVSFCNRYRIKFEEYQDKLICQIEISKSNNKVYCKGVYYIRNGNQTISPSHEEYDKI